MSTAEPEMDENLPSWDHKRIRAAREKDQKDVSDALERERSFMVEWNRLSTNRIWAEEQGTPVVLYQDSVDEYKGGKKVFPWGRNVEKLSVYSQIWDYFRFCWHRTRPYKVVALIIVLTLASPINTFLLGYISNEIVEDPTNVPVWLYFSPFFLSAARHFLYWWYEMWVPLNSQRYQLRCILLTQRVRLPNSHPLALRWSAGRFVGLLKDVDVLVNGVWKSCLQIIEILTTVFWTLFLCMVNLAKDMGIGTELEELTAQDYGIYVGLFLGFAFLVLALPFVWFRFFVHKLSLCEEMVQQGQAFYLSAAFHAVTAEGLASAELEMFERVSSETHHGETAIGEESMTSVGKKAFRVYAFTTFRSFFFRLAWTTNYDLITQLGGPLVAYWLLTARDFGSQSLTSTIIILNSLGELTKISGKLLSLLAVMAKGCLILVSVAQLLNVDANELDGTFVEQMGAGASLKLAESKREQDRATKIQ